MFLTLFRKAGATGHVFLLKNGSSKSKGLAWSGFILPSTTVAVIPTTARILDFSVDARTKDKQNVSVTGNLKVVLDPNVASKRFDFTVDPQNGSYTSQWEEDLQAIVLERVLGPMRREVKTLTIEDAVLAHGELEAIVKDALTGDANPLSARGITVESCSVDRIEAEDEDVAQSIGAKERETMLAAADKATHDRRIAAATNERAVQTYEARTKLELEKERANLIKKQGENKTTEAAADAEAIKIRLAPMNEVEPNKLLAASIMEMARSGRIGSLTISPELLAAINGTRNA